MLSSDDEPGIYMCLKVDNVKKRSKHLFLRQKQRECFYMSDCMCRFVFYYYYSVNKL